MDLSVIIVSYNTSQITKECIESVIASLRDSGIKYEILVVDNNSSDDSVAQLKNLSAEHKQLHLIENDKNLGFGPANNLGVKKSKGEYLLLLNSDTVVLNNAIEKLLNFTKSNNDADFVGGKLLNKDQTPQPSTGPYYSLPVIFGALFLRGDYWGLTRQSPEKVKRVDWISGACILTKKEYYEKLDGFDEDIFMYMEEIDLLHRARELGYHVYFYPDAHFIHYGSLSSGNRTYPILQVYRGFIYLYNKHHSKLARACLAIMLQLKADIAIIIGKLSHNPYLVRTYEEAKTLASQQKN